MVATINQQVEQTEECVSTCRFAQRVALVKNSSAINEELDPSLVRCASSLTPVQSATPLV